METSVQASASQREIKVPPDVVVYWDGDIALTSTRDAAKIVGVAQRTIYNWVERDLVEFRMTPSGKLRIVIASLWRRPVDAEPVGGR